jgi:hypothetical protein
VGSIASFKNDHVLGSFRREKGAKKKKKKEKN